MGRFASVSLRFRFTVGGAFILIRLSRDRFWALHCTMGLLLIFRYRPFSSRRFFYVPTRTRSTTLQSCFLCWRARLRRSWIMRAT